MAQATIEISNETVPVDSNYETEAKYAALNRIQAIIEFNLDGTIVTANENFLKTMGYTLPEIQGKHHKIFCDPTYVASGDYQSFWNKLHRGEVDFGEYRRLGKNGKEVWIQASYNPIFNASGKVYKVVKFATDVSAQKLKDAELAALSKAQAVIEFTPDGTILNANQNFLNAMGYALGDLTGKHHSMFCDPNYVKSQQYRDFWHKLKNGSFDSGQYKRIARGGREVWIQASYNPVFDLNGNVFKVVKYATDITKQKKDSLALLEALNETVTQLAAAAEQLTATATRLTDNSEQTTRHAAGASRSSESVTDGIVTVAQNMEEMVLSIKEISRSSQESSQMAKSTFQMAENTNTIISQLGASSQEIGTVIKVISSIAQQTNLLALNATIEAARAGEAGKGFAVVANEVKELAKQTGKATEDITNRIVAIQRDSKGAVDAIGRISESIDKLNGISSLIAAAVEEQTATTNEVSRVVSDAKKGVETINQSLRLVSNASIENSSSSKQTLEASQGLAQLATKLANLVKEVNL